MREVIVKNQPGVKQLPRYIRRALLSDAGEVFLSGAAFGGGEANNIMKAGFDGIEIVSMGNHAYFPATWLATEYPQHEDAILTIAECARRRLEAI